MSLAYATSPQPNYANANALGGSEVHRNAMALGSRLAAVTPVAKMKPDEQHAVINYKDGSLPLTKRLLQAHAEAHGGERDPTQSMQDGIADTTYQDIHDKMHSGFARMGAKAPEDFSTFSGVGHEMGEKIRLSKGEPFHAPAWISSSLNPQVAHSFGDSQRNPTNANNSSYHIVQFKIPKGSQHGTYIGHAFGSFQHEFEYTIHAGTKWKKTRTTKHVQNTFDGTHTTYLHVMEPHVE